MPESKSVTGVTGDTGDTALWKTPLQGIEIPLRPLGGAMDVDLVELPFAIENCLYIWFTLSTQV